jgi:hypothetical protein
MTDRSREPGRIDLRAIDEPADTAQADRVIAAALARRSEPAAATAGVLMSIEAYTGPLVAIAAGLIIAASGTLLLTRGRVEADPPTSVVANWAESSHVPTNGELLATFQGYGR